MISLSISVALAEDTHRYALLVGTNDGGPDRATLRYAHDDAQSMEDVLVSLGGVTSSRAEVLLDPDVERLRTAFADLADEIGADAVRTEVVFYFSGHSDEDGLLLGEDHLPWKELRTSIEGLNATVRVAILDSCASGALILAKGGTHVSPFLVDSGTSVEGSAYLTSSSADEVSQEGERVGGSYFTHALRSGLLGAADVSGDGRVTLNEAYSFARDETLQQTERTQHGPQHANFDLQLEGSGDLVLTDLTSRSALLVLTEGLEGRVTVRTEALDLVAELQKTAPQVVELALSPGDYVVSVLPSEGERYGESTVSLEDDTSSLVGLADLSFEARDRTVARKGGPERTTNGLRLTLFPVAPGRADVDRLALGLVGARSTALDGIGLAMGWYAVDESASGLAAALGVVSVGDLDGTELSMGISHAGSGAGLQATVGGNVVERGFDGVQASMGFNAAGHGIRGLQTAAGFNLAPGGLRGLQLASGFNGAGGEVVGAQIAPLNLAADVDGFQIGTANAARDVDGAQISLVNVARNVKGLQLGLVNYATHVDGVPIGLLSIVKDGRHSVLVGGSDTDPLSVEVKSGAAFHTGLSAGYWPDRHVSAGVTAGFHFTPGRLWVDLDGGTRSYLPVGPALEGRAFGVEDSTLMVQGRGTVGFQLTSLLAPYVGAGVNFRVVDGSAAPSALGGDPQVAPTVFAGLQLF